MLASMKLLHIPLNLLNVLAFRLVLAIGVDYGIYIVLSGRTRATLNTMSQAWLSRCCSPA